MGAFSSPSGQRSIMWLDGGQRQKLGQLMVAPTGVSVDVCINIDECFVVTGGGFQFMDDFSAPLFFGWINSVTIKRIESGK